MKYYVTLNLFSFGIRELELKEWDDGRFSHNAGETFSGTEYFKEGRDCFLKKEDALAKANDMKARKIASLKKALAAVEKLEF